MAVLDAILLAVMLVGLLSLVIPGMPGLVVIWVAVLTYAIITGFHAWWVYVIFGVITLLMIAGNLADNFIMGANARNKGASWLAIGGAFLAGFIASFFLTPVGGLLVMLGGLFLVEMIRLKDWREALNSTGGMALGFGQAVVVRGAIGVVMIGLWVLWALVF
jgi:uncharacterized protein YqgC (DUF456 family)